jgi:hypothetical protein
MHTTPLPEIAESDLKAVREFLTSFRDEDRVARMPRIPLGGPGAGSGAGAGSVPVRNGIARARTRPASKATG